MSVVTLMAIAKINFKWNKYKNEWNKLFYIIIRPTRLKSYKARVKPSNILLRSMHLNIEMILLKGVYASHRIGSPYFVPKHVNASNRLKCVFHTCYMPTYPFI